jgi:2'-5' RNA ligase
VIRAFVGIRIDTNMALRVAEVQSQLKTHLDGIRWVATEKFHFTIKFLGPVHEDRIHPIANALAQALAGVRPFLVSGRGIGVFPDIKRPRVIWAGLSSKELENIVQRVDEAVEPLGFNREARPFKPHLTLGRWRNSGTNPDKLRQELDRWKDSALGESWVKEIVLFQSLVTPQGAVYSPLHILSLADSPNQGG